MRHLIREGNGRCQSLSPYPLRRGVDEEEDDDTEEKRKVWDAANTFLTR